MSAYYGEGSMYGSGIDSEDITREVDCECGFSGEIDMRTDDAGESATGDCPQCGTEHLVYLKDYADEPYEE